MTLRLWPRSLMGQMLLAVALALVLAYRAGAERREAALLHSAAYRFLSETRDRHEIAEGGDRRRRGGFRLERTTSSPLRTGELRETQAESELRRILVDQDFTPGDI